MTKTTYQVDHCCNVVNLHTPTFQIPLLVVVSQLKTPGIPNAALCYLVMYQSQFLLFPGIHNSLTNFFSCPIEVSRVSAFEKIWSGPGMSWENWCKDSHLVSKEAGQLQCFSMVYNGLVLPHLPHPHCTSLVWTTLLHVWKCWEWGSYYTQVGISSECSKQQYKIQWEWPVWHTQMMWTDAPGDGQAYPTPDNLTWEMSCSLSIVMIYSLNLHPSRSHKTPI